MDYLKILTILILSISNIKFTFSVNILYLNIVPSPSHFIWNRALIQKLATEGHNLTVISPDIEKSHRNISYIHLEKMYRTLYNENAVDLYEMASLDLYHGVHEFYDTFGSTTCTGT